MKVVYDSQIFAAQKYGGISRYFCEIASRIAMRPDVQVSIKAPMHINAYLDGVPKDIVSGFHAPKTRRFRRIQRGLGIIAGDLMMRAEHPDIVHETYFFPVRLGPRRARRVLTIYDMIHEKFPTSSPQLDNTALYKEEAAKRADHVICISESTRRDAIDILGLPSEKTSVIYLGFDLMNAGAGGGGAPGTQIETNRPFLLYVGNRGGYKNFDMLLEVYAATPELRSDFDLVCFGGGELNAAEMKLMLELGVSGGCVRHVSGGDQLLAQYYKNASAFIYPSQYEGFGIPPLEAMAHGCPVVCSNTSSIPEVVGDGGEYFNPYDKESMRAAITHVIGSHARRNSLISDGYNRLPIFSWDRCAAETFEVYKGLL